MAQYDKARGGDYESSPSAAASMASFDRLPKSVRERIAASPVEFHAASVVEIVSYYGEKGALVQIDQKINGYLQKCDKERDKMIGEAITYRAWREIAKRQAARVFERRIPLVGG